MNPPPIVRRAHLPHHALAVRVVTDGQPYLVLNSGDATAELAVALEQILRVDTERTDTVAIVDNSDPWSVSATAAAIDRMVLAGHDTN